MSWSPVLLLVLAALVPAGRALGGEEGISESPQALPHAFFGGRVGYLKVENVDTGSLNLGFVGGYAFDRILAIEGSLDYHTAEYSGNDRATTALEASVLVYPFPKLRRIRPYASGGVGVYYSDYDVSGEADGPSEERVWDNGFQAGFGFDAPIADLMDGGEVLFNMDVRYLFTQEEADDPHRIEPDGVLASVGVKFLY